MRFRPINDAAFNCGELETNVIKLGIEMLPLRFVIESQQQPQGFTTKKYQIIQRKSRTTDIWPKNLEYEYGIIELTLTNWMNT